MWNYPNQNINNLAWNNQQNYQQTLQQNNTNLNWIKINNLQELENIKIQPNQKIWVMFTNEPIFGVKTADSMGIVTTELFRFEKIEAPKPPEYVTKDDLNILFENFKNTIAGMLPQQQSNTKLKKVGDN